MKKEENSIIKEDMKARKEGKDEGIKETENDEGSDNKRMVKDVIKDKVVVKPKEEEEKSMYNNKNDKTELMEVHGKKGVNGIKEEFEERETESREEQSKERK